MLNVVLNVSYVPKTGRARLNSINPCFGLPFDLAGDVRFTGPRGGGAVSHRVRVPPSPREDLGGEARSPCAAANFQVLQ